MAVSDRSVFFNQSTAPLSPFADTSAVQTFHQQLRSYKPTPLVPLEGIAKELGVKSVFLKDEGNRLGLPSFKILGASWGVYRALVSRLGLPQDSLLTDIAQAAQQPAMAKILNLPAHIYVPSTVNGADIGLIYEAGAKVILTEPHYDDAIVEAFSASRSTQGGLLIQDSSFDGYEQIPAWIVEGYSTLLTEIKQQLSEQGLNSTLIVSPVGVGSLARAVVSHCKAKGRQCRFMSVEPDNAPCLHQNPRSGQSVPIHASKFATIMDGLNCGTVSKEAFGDLQPGVDVSVIVSNIESHQAVLFLEDVGVRIGPCGAATLAALWKLRAAEATQPRRFLSDEAVVVLLGTESHRRYQVPVLHQNVSAPDTVT